MAEVFTPAYTYVDGRLTEFLNERLGSVIAQVEGPLRLALVLYVVLYGWAVLRGAVSEPIMDGVVRLVKLLFIYVIATTVAYSQYVTGPLFTDLPNTLTQAISGASTPSVGAAFDEFFNRGGYLAEKIFDSASITNPGPYLTGALVYMAAALTAALGFGVTMIAKVALALLVALGPIFIACLVFEATRRFFWGWLAQGVNYLVLFALMITIFQLVLSLVDSQWSNIDGQPDPQVAGLLFIALCALGAIFFLQCPSMAAGIAGGASTGIRDFAAASRMAASTIPLAGGGGRSSGGGRGASPSGGSIRPAR